MSEQDLARLIEAMSESLSAEITLVRTDLHAEMKAGFERIDARMDAFDRRLKHTDANVTTALEMLVRQSRWHQETDAKVESDATRIGKLEADVAAIKQRLNIV
jgi:hypothetical protein